MLTPTDVYEASPRTFPKKLPEWEYPDEYEVRRVRSCGGIKWHGYAIRIGDAFAGQSIGLELVGEGIYRIYLGSLSLGAFHEASRKIIPSPT